MANNHTPVLAVGSYQGVPITHVPQTYLHKLLHINREPECTWATDELLRRGYPTDANAQIIVSGHALNRFSQHQFTRTLWQQETDNGRGYMKIGLLTFIQNLLAPRLRLHTQAQQSCTLYTTFGTRTLRWRYNCYIHYSTRYQELVVSYEIVTMNIEKGHTKHEKEATTRTH